MSDHVVDAEKYAYIRLPNGDKLLGPVTIEKFGGLTGEILSVDEVGLSDKVSIDKLVSYTFNMSFKLGARRWRRMLRAVFATTEPSRRLGAGLKPWHRRRLKMDCAVRRYYRPHD